MDVTLPGIVTAVNEEHAANAESPMDVTLPGIVTAVKSVRFLNIASPMDVTVFEIVRTVPSKVHNESGSMSPSLPAPPRKRKTRFKCCSATPVPSKEAAMPVERLKFGLGRGGGHKKLEPAETYRKAVGGGLLGSLVM